MTKAQERKRRWYLKNRKLKGTKAPGGRLPFPWPPPNNGCYTQNYKFFLLDQAGVDVLALIRAAAGVFPDYADAESVAGEALVLAVRRNPFNHDYTAPQWRKFLLTKMRWAILSDMRKEMLLKDAEAQLAELGEGDDY